jgi:hypothetical protein
MLGETGNDINIWAPGDGGDAYAADLGFRWSTRRHHREAVRG